MTPSCSIAPSAAPDRGRVTGAYLQPLIEAARARGVDAAQLAQAVGLAPAALWPLPESLAARDYIALLDAGARLTGDLHFGLHVGERVRPATFSVYGLVLMACRDFGQALEQTQRYEQLAHDLGRSHLTLEGADALYGWTSHYPAASRHLVESVFAGIRVFGSWLAGQPLGSRQIALCHHSDAPADEYVRVLGMLPRFGASANVARFDAALLAAPVPNADPSLYPVLRQHAERLLGERGAEGGSILVQVRAAVVRQLARCQARLPSVAQELGMSARTLQRKLADAGASFQQVLDGVRYELARDYLRQRDLGLVDIAFLLGYQEQSAFTHAFREWSGVNPGAWRERECGG
ncbi:AraC family transcriptional regulator [Massilia yuzhufengensis]|uniref:Transcriptional regulator, AraC family n=1 Tax=Massilia yuzhufengensis TaxID=1164594 RepID=A0A1I1GLE8_9BURK|nr:AraC family transcriptional regulator [Massilia yuzhufengensis]SFC12275.1 transcriptional regulator, AraC family [Massilia yuzhufengensis]